MNQDTMKRIDTGESSPARGSIRFFCRASLRMAFVATVFVGFSLLVYPAAAQDDFSDQEIEFFETKIRPILADRCFECHGPEAAPIEGGLNMATRQSLLDGGDSGAAVVPGDPSESLLIDTINYGDLYEMPPDTKLPQDEIDLLTEWVEMGAPWPTAKGEVVVAKESFSVERLKKEHWCWQAPKKVTVPKVKNADWPASDIDRFILAKIEDVQLSPAEPADRRTLLRRLYFDLIGLPPAPDEIDSFLADDSDEAITKLVDQLLADPRFGEHWARHWMDLVRYAETCGHEFEYPIPHAWRYRDYLIRAFNQDVPFDQFAREHIAGDLLENPRRHPDQEFNESIIGTGFWYLGEDVHGPVDVRADLADHYENQIDVLSKSFLGLTVACARCHDHKFDAIATKDYYALAGFIKSSRRQLVMLDPFRKIEKGWERANSIQAQANEEINRWQNHSPAGPPDRFADYLAAAMQFNRAKSKAAASQVTLQGEAMKWGEVANGTVRIQEIKPQGTFSWQGDKQFWWLDGKPGDELALKFNSPIEGLTKIAANFTLAPDYGIADILINNQPARTGQDFYAAELATTGPIDLGQFQLKKGENEIKFVLKGHHEQAIPRHMVGLDYLSLLSIGEPQGVATLNELAERASLDKESLKRIATAIESLDDADLGHPLALAKMATKASYEELDSTFGRADKTHATTEKSNGAGVLFEDFSNGIPEDWFVTGFAFGSAEEKRNVADGGALSAEGDIFRAPGIVSSGFNGRRFEGVLRSPTFKISHDRIHYRIRGENVKVRLIIEGYVMDVYNALLFKGATVTVNSPKRFTWQQQAGDIKNYKGLRAHLEFIDHGDGWCEIDEIRFSNQRPPTEKADGISVAAWHGVTSADQQPQAKSKPPAESQVPLTQIATCVSAELFESKGLEDSRWMSWVVENELAGLVFGDASAEEDLNGQGPSISNGRGDRLMGHAALAERILGLRGQLREQAGELPKPIYAPGIADGTGEDEFVYVRGNHKNLGEVAPRSFLSALTDEAPKYSKSGRMDLANRITDPNNPLTARVITNRLWHHLLGRGIVASVDNFGVLGEAPTHPELLDFLATEFVSDGWSLKRMIRRIVLSRTYQQSSKSNPKAADVDPENILLHRANIRRIASESIRDAVLSVAGKLKKDMYGPPVPIHLTPFMQGRGRPGQSGPLDGNGRRSVYIAVRRNFLSPMMLAFDTPIPFNTVEDATVERPGSGVDPDE